MRSAAKSSQAAITGTLQLAAQRCGRAEHEALHRALGACERVRDVAVRKPIDAADTNAAR